MRETRWPSVEQTGAVVVPAEPSTKAKAWAIFDHIVNVSAPQGHHSDPWQRNDSGSVSFKPDFDVLTQLLGVPIHLGASTKTGVPALALDVWLSYELRRAGFEPDAVWPRSSEPRVLPFPIVNLLKSLPNTEREKLRESPEVKILNQGCIRGEREHPRQELPKAG